MDESAPFQPPSRFNRARARVARFFRRQKGPIVAKEFTGTRLAMKSVLSVRNARGIPSLAQWRELPRFLSQSERRVAVIASLVVVLAVVGLVGQFIFSRQASVPAIGGTYTEGLVGFPQFINPLYASASDTDADLAKLVFSGLMRFDPEGGLVPDLAESFTVSDDGKTYTFVLRDNATFHDGDKVTAEDVVFTVTTIQNPDYASPLAVGFAGVTVSSIDEKTLRFTLDEPFSPFLSALTVGILPAHIWQDVPASSAQLTSLNLKPIGSGPYMFQKLVKDQNGTLRSMTFGRNPSFYRGAPYIETMTFKFANDLSELSKWLRNKNVEGASVLSYADAASFGDDRAVRVLAPTIPQYTAVFFNQKHSGVLADANVRKALITATDRAAIATLLGESATPASSILVGGVPGYDANTSVPAPDPTSAATLLESSGWTIAEGDHVRAKKGVQLAFSVTTLNVPELVTTADELKKEWETIGASVTVTVVNASDLQNSVRKNRDYDALLSGERFSSFPDAYPFWHSSQVNAPGLNLALFASSKADAAIETARATSDGDKRVAAFTTLSAAINDAYAADFLFQPAYTFAVSSSIRGISLPRVAVPSDRFSRVETWFMKTKRWFK